MPEFEQLKDDDPDYLLIKDYKTAHGINRDCNDPDVVVLMRRARMAERLAIMALLGALSHGLKATQPLQQHQWFSECERCRKPHTGIAPFQPDKCVHCGGRLLAVGGLLKPKE